MPVLLTSSGIQYSDSTVTTTKPFPIGANTIFCQAAAPTNWTRINRNDNSMIRVITTSGGGTGGIHDISTGITGSHVPAHTHTANSTSGVSSDHTHTVSVTGHNHTGLRTISASTGNMYQTGSQMASYSAGNMYWNTYRGYNSYTVALDTSHTHSGTTNTNPSSSNWVPKYVDFIFCQKTS